MRVVSLPALDTVKLLLLDHTFLLTEVVAARFVQSLSAVPRLN